MFVHPLIHGPAVIKLGPICLPYYGIAFSLALLIFDYLGQYRAKQFSHLTTENLINLWLYLLIGVILGARIGDIIFYRLYDVIHHPWLFRCSQLPTYNAWIGLFITILGYIYTKWVLEESLPLALFSVPLLLLATGDAGMSLHGAFIGVVIAVLVYSYSFERRFLVIMDFIAPLTPPGLGIGRFANFLNGELWGRPTHMPWGMIFPRVDFQPRHPSQLYECFLEGPLLFVILWYFSKHSREEGAVFGLSITLYAIIRILIEFVREPTTTGFLTFKCLTMGQLLSIPMLFTGVFLLVKTNWASQP